MSVVTRFAPSPTGYLHIGGARTALFNWLYAKNLGGKFLLRIEDTDRARSTDAATAAIYEGLQWLGLDWDGDAISQFQRASRHAEVALEMLAMGKAYYCYASPEELEEMRAKAIAEGRSPGYDGRWRDRDPAEAPAGVKPVIRLKAPQTGTTTVHDKVRGEVTIQNSQLDDMVLLRSDGTPTYMLAVVVDDHDMNVTHVIRGDDHFTNTFRQLQIYQAMGWELPVFAHVPLIHGPDGAKLSKRHGALGVDAYRDMGYLPEAMRNYLLRLGWSHGDDEIFSTEQAIAWFNLESLGSSPSRFDFAKLENLNGHYIRHCDDTLLVNAIQSRLAEWLGNSLTDAQLELLTLAMPGLKARATTLNILAESARFYFKMPQIDTKAASLITDESRALLKIAASKLAELKDFDSTSIENSLRILTEEQNVKLGAIAQPLRAALTGSTISPPIFEAAAILGRETVLERLGMV